MPRGEICGKVRRGEEHDAGDIEKPTTKRAGCLVFLQFEGG